MNGAEYLCATVDLFRIQVILCVGDRDECAKLIDANRSKDYHGPNVGKGFIMAVDAAEAKSVCPAVAYTTFVQPVVIIYAPEPIKLSTLVHEISHAVDYIAEIVGFSDGETRAYLSAYLLSELAPGHCNDIVRPNAGKRGRKGRGK